MELKIAKVCSTDCDDVFKACNFSYIQGKGWTSQWHLSIEVMSDVRKCWHLFKFTEFNRRNSHHNLACHACMHGKVRSINEQIEPTLKSSRQMIRTEDTPVKTSVAPLAAQVHSTSVRTLGLCFSAERVKFNLIYAALETVLVRASAA